MTVTVSFEENGSEYIGYFTASGVKKVSYDPARPRSIQLDGIAVVLDEEILEVSFLGSGSRVLAEAWTVTEETMG